MSLSDFVSLEFCGLLVAVVVLLVDGGSIITIKKKKEKKIQLDGLNVAK